MTVAMASWLQKINSKNFCYALNSQLSERSKQARRKKSKHPSISNDMYGIRFVHSFPFSVLSSTIYLLLVFSSIWCSILHGFVGRHQHRRCNVETKKSAKESSVVPRLFLFWLFHLFVQRRTLVCAAATRKVKGAMNRQLCRCSECARYFRC